MASMYDNVGGEPTLRKLAEDFHASVMRDPLLQSLFRYTGAGHVNGLTAFLVEVFGGPRTFSDEFGGFLTLMRKHRGRRISEEQRKRFVELFITAAEEAGLPMDDERFRTAFIAQVDRGAGFSMAVSHPDGPKFAPPYPELGRWEW